MLITLVIYYLCKLLLLLFYLLLSISLFSISLLGSLSSFVIYEGIPLKQVPSWFFFSLIVSHLLIIFIKIFLLCLFSVSFWFFEIWFGVCLWNFPVFVLFPQIKSGEVFIVPLMESLLSVGFHITVTFVKTFRGCFAAALANFKCYFNSLFFTFTGKSLISRCIICSAGNYGLKFWKKIIILVTLKHFQNSDLPKISKDMEFIF